MAQHPFLKSIRPVNLLSFGPKTEEIELRPLNILIGPNGSGKSNLLEAIRLLHYLPDKDPWSVVLATGGASEWVFKGAKNGNLNSSLNATFSLGEITGGHSASSPRVFDCSIVLEKYQASFRVSGETIGTINAGGGRNKLFSWFERSGSQGEIHMRHGRSNAGPVRFDLNLDRSVLAQLSSPQLQPFGIGQALPELFEMVEFFEALEFHQDWEFGADLAIRDPIPVGQAIDRLEEGGYNLAQMLAYYRDYNRAVYVRVHELMRQFYEPFEGLEVRLIGTHLQAAMQEEGGFSTPAYRLSDGTLRWLALLTILLNPTPAPVTCIDEPELGLHPDMIPTLADLLRDASTRTQLILTTHSQSLVECFSDDPECVCICEKVDGATRIHRLNKEKLSSWLDDYSLGQLWAKGEIRGKPLVKVRIFVEGGPKSCHADGLRRFKNGFKLHLARLDPLLNSLDVSPCGSTEDTIRDFAHALREQCPNHVLALLVDSDAPVTAESPAKHLRTKLDSAKIPALARENTFLMVQCMEAWLVTDADALVKCFGKRLNANALPPNPNIEAVPKKGLIDALASAVKSTPSEKYHKVQHGAEILAVLDPERVAQRSSHARDLHAFLRRSARA